MQINTQKEVIRIVETDDDGIIRKVLMFSPKHKIQNYLPNNEVIGENIKSWIWAVNCKWVQINYDQVVAECL